MHRMVKNEFIKNWILPSIDDRANMSSQLELLHKAGCQEIFKEKLSGSNIARPELRKLLDYIRKGDTVTVTKLDRLARSTKDLLKYC
jgi:DNA invertase Pin-like site-specific DNA recombinase